jgi:tetratricopeptide (TPR) repeat protein
MRIVVLSMLSAVTAFSAGCGHSQPNLPKALPPNEEAVVIFKTTDGRTLTAADLRGLSGTVRYEVLGKSNVSAEAEALHQQARQAGQAGDYKKAITALEQASRLAPTWPYPVYDMAFTYLLMNDAENALKYYRKTVDLSPRGFFTAITARDALSREATGELPSGTYLKYLALEWLDSPAKKAEVVRKLIELFPGFAPVWKEMAILVDNDVEKLAAIEKGLAANPDRETKGILLINKAIIMNRGGDREGAVQMLGELALDPESTYGTEHLAKITLAALARP